MKVFGYRAAVLTLLFCGSAHAQSGCPAFQEPEVNFQGVTNGAQMEMVMSRIRAKVQAEHAEFVQCTIDYYHNGRDNTGAVMDQALNDYRDTVLAFYRKLDAASRAYLSRIESQQPAHGAS